MVDTSPYLCTDTSYTGILQGTFLGGCRSYYVESNVQFKNPMLFHGPIPNKPYKCRPTVVKDSFKRTSNKTISRVGRL